MKCPISPVLPLPQLLHYRIKAHNRVWSSSIVPKNSILQPGQSYTFSSYFDLPYELHEIVAEFGYTSSISKLNLPSELDVDKERISILKDRTERILPYIGMKNETARREILIAPILIEVVDYTHARLSLEYPLNVSEQLKGTLDYYLRNHGQILVVEAKKADLEAGFNQLAVELIAMDQWTDSTAPILYGAVSNGNTWQFGQLRREEKLIEQDLNFYQGVADLEKLIQILVAIVN